MFSQFFGYELLQSGLVNEAQMQEALARKAETKVKLGVMAINAGYMTAGQVERVHEQQKLVDKRIGDIAVDMGFITAEQVNGLLTAQKPAHLLLGQTLVDLGFLSNAQLETALAGFKAKYGLSDEDFINEAACKAKAIVVSYLQLAEKDDLLAEYVILLYKSLTRFITDDYTPVAANDRAAVPDAVIMQEVTGPFAAETWVEGAEAALTAFATRFAGESLESLDDFAEGVVSEFMNLNNGMFAVKLSKERELELSLEPPVVTRGKAAKNGGIVVPVGFAFGVVWFVIKTA